MSARPAPPGAPLDSVRAVKRAMQDAALAPATLPGQVATFGQIVLAAGLAAAWLDDATPLVLTALVLGTSVVVGLTTPIGTWFRQASGVVVALCGLFLALVVHAVTDARLFGPQAPWVFLTIALVPIGLDWRFVPRLRARTACSGVVVVPLVGAHEPWAFAGAVAWFAGAVVTLWVLERDVQRAAMRPARTTPTDAAPPVRVADVVRPIVAGLAIGLVLAFLIGDVSCSTRPRSVTPPSARPGPPAPAPPGQTATVEGDRVVVRDPDGTTRTYDRDEAGRPRVRVDGPDGVRTFVYDESDGGMEVTEYDAGGNVVDRYRDDPLDRPAPDASDDGEVPWRWIVAVALLAAAVSAAVMALARRRRDDDPGDRDWAHRMAARIEVEGRRRGVVRGRDETVVDYAASLAAGALPDARLLDVAQTVSAAMFGRREADAATRGWVEQTLDRIVADNPTGRRVRTRT